MYDKDIKVIKKEIKNEYVKSYHSKVKKKDLKRKILILHQIFYLHILNKTKQRLNN